MVDDECQAPIRAWHHVGVHHGGAPTEIQGGYFCGAGGLQQRQRQIGVNGRDRLERQIPVGVCNHRAGAADQKSKAVGRGPDGANRGNDRLQHDVTGHHGLHLARAADQIRKRDDQLARAGTDERLGNRRPACSHRPLVPGALGGVVIGSARPVFRKNKMLVWKAHVGLIELRRLHRSLQHGHRIVRGHMGLE